MCDTMKTAISLFCALCPAMLFTLIGLVYNLKTLFSFDHRWKCLIFFQFRGRAQPKPLDFLDTRWRTCTNNGGYIRQLGSRIRSSLNMKDTLNNKASCFSSNRSITWCERNKNVFLRYWWLKMKEKTSAKLQNTSFVDCHLFFKEPCPPQKQHLIPAHFIWCHFKRWNFPYHM